MPEESTMSEPLTTFLERIISYLMFQLIQTACKSSYN
jgi:hypothetical protein